MENKRKNKGEGLLLKSELFWDTASQKEQREAEKLAEEYKDFLDVARTEKQTIRRASELARKSGFVEINLDEKLPKGKTRMIFVNRGKSAIMVEIGKKGLEVGASFLIAHVDSPRMDLKVKPLYEDGGIAYLKPNYYGGIKKYHWPVTPLAMQGTVVLKNGQEIEINIGLKENDPVFVISDLLPHLDNERMDKPLGKAIDAEELNIIVGTRPVADKKVKDRVKMAVLEWLNKNYKISEEELFTADIRFVPAYKPKDVGFDRGLIASYGQDDRVCVFAALKAFLEAKNKRPSILYLVDKEEIGSIGSTGAESLFLENVVSYLTRESKVEIDVYDFYRKSKGVSADVTAAYDPDYKQAYDINNVAQLGHGVVIEKYLGHRGKSYTMEAE
ncbi:MAG TPA: aminopeptidase, partial [Patescibacteria group bacterium]|nr:aminopeptidase [Patescibacteria group bacterium]